MSDLFPAATTDDVALELKLAELQREIAVRQGVYPKWVAAGKLTQEMADKRILILQAVYADLVKWNI